MNKDEELRLEQQVSRGLNAEAILNNPEFKRAFTAIRGELILQFERTKFKEEAERTEIWRKMQTVDWFEGIIVKIMTNGEVARKTLAQRVKETTNRLLRRV